MIDIHAHVLPGLDDGPRDSVATVALLEAAAAAGTRVIAATPHVRGDHPRVAPLELAERAQAVNALARRYDLPLRVVPGAEVDLGMALLLDAEALTACTLAANGQDLLVETPYGALTADFEERLDEVRARGFRVVLAHPERNPTLQRNPHRLGALVEAGALVQVTAGSLTGARRSASRRLAVEAIRAGWVHALASDAHAVDWRPPDLSAGVRAAMKAARLSEAQALLLVEDGPEAILRGIELPAPPRAPGDGGSLLRF